MTREFALEYPQRKDEPAIKDCVQHVLQYTNKLRTYGIHDYMVFQW